MIRLELQRCYFQQWLKK